MPVSGDVLAAARVLLAWDGTAYGGWQLQPNVETVQGAVERVLAQLMDRDRVIARAAGRLDAGVHAEAQVVSFAVMSRRTTRELFRGMNGLLPDDIACLALSSAADGYDPRRENCGKTYRYRFLVRENRCPFRRTRCWHLGRALDLESMRRAARWLLGAHDFTSFRASGCTALHPVRMIRSIELDLVGDEVHLVVHGNAFLRYQVRIMAGCLAEVGLGRQPPEWMGAVLAAADRNRAARTAPAHGLTLERVHFWSALDWEHGEDPGARSMRADVPSFALGNR